jgi:hypothetical protein
MNWYLAKLVYQVICGDGDHTPQFDEQLRLIASKSEEEAFYKARHIGRMEQESFFNDRHHIVRWTFIDVCELYQLNELIDGAELYSRIQEADNAENYIHVIRRKAGNLEGSAMLRSLQL